MMAGSQQKSIRRRIAIGAFVLLAVLSAALIFFALNNARRAADEAFDRLIGASALSIADGIRVEADRITVELPQAALAMLGQRSEARIFYRVTGPTGALISGQVTLGLNLPAATDIEPQFSNGEFRGAPVRLAITGRYFDTGWTNVIVAETLESRQALAMKLFWPPVIALMAIALLALALIWFGVRFAFRPLARIEDELRLRTSTDLHPIASDTPLEVSQLVSALDDFMARLQGTLDRIRNTASHAAHEVRTPIAVIRAQATAALGETDLELAKGRLRRIEANADAAGQIVNQILVDASVQHRLGTFEPGPVNLHMLCCEVIDRLDPLLQAAVRLEAINASPEDCLALGDPVAIREAIRNLVDNALKYAPTGTVDINLERLGGSWQIEVADKGPGIADADKDHVTGRFKRGNNVIDVPGAGLGLDIVRQVAKAYSGTLALENRVGGGLSARLLLKAATTVAALILGFAWCLTLTTSQPAQAQSAVQNRLSILMSPDTGLVDRLIDGFKTVRPDVEITVQRVNAQIISTLLRGQDAFGTGPDLVMSHAADLQVELVNEGYALINEATAVKALPAWAAWRRELITYALDYGTITYRKSAIPDNEFPHSRVELARFLDRVSEAFKGRVATYDIGNNSLAYILATQEARFSTAYWRLVRTFGGAEVRLFWTTDEILEAFKKNDIDIAYNLIASEIGEFAADQRYAIVKTEDYLLTVPRTLFIPRNTRSPNLASEFTEFVLSEQGQAIVRKAGALSVRALGLNNTSNGKEALTMRPVALGPGLLALRDLNTRSNFLETWLQLVLTK
jgi:two-component system, OmpR family, sensor histidine kinase TctE